ncbi:hypothetical protein D8M04_17810 [Oceanobacillus piezotolerans]|uniref:DUF3221 domain-containing protein n=1 Tax=Oceanobacillus piezotolerans TaxID=2448030 RepID=A0A498D1U8_9BACI|nr:hypothetical protein [Oceanobacillus piezotolerans]RLL41101.1 hypothetical protein D8M04_17810 [Oceanobacillus piezotolerans]
MVKKLHKVLGLFLFLLLMGCSDSSLEEPIIYEGIIQGKYFQKGTVSTGVGLSTGGKPVVTTNSTLDEYIIFVDDEDYSVSKDIWLSLEEGAKIQYELGFWGIENIVIMGD